MFFRACAYEIYESQVRPQVEAGNHGKLVAIDIETGEFEVADTPMVAVDQLYERLPENWVELVEGCIAPRMAIISDPFFGG